MKPENLTDAELDEWRYRYEERLALLGASEWPTKLQASTAAREADQVIEELRRNQQP